MSTIVIQITGQSLTDDSIHYHFKLEGVNTQDAHEPIGIFHGVTPGTYKLSATFEGKTLEGEVTVDAVIDSEGVDHSDGMARTVWLTP